MPLLHLGVAVLPYGIGGGKKTTYDVGSILEEKYGLFSAFWQAEGRGVVDLMARDLERALVSGKKPSFAYSMSEGTRRFKQFISSQEAERVGIPGTPTKAALAGVNHRFVHPYVKGNPRRPSFLDTKQLQASLMLWVD